MQPCCAAGKATVATKTSAYDLPKRVVPAGCQPSSKLGSVGGRRGEGLVNMVPTRNAKKKPGSRDPLGKSGGKPGNWPAQKAKA